VRHPDTFELTFDLRLRGFFGLWGVSRWELQASFWQRLAPDGWEAELATEAEGSDRGGDLG